MNKVKKLKTALFVLILTILSGNNDIFAANGIKWELYKCSSDLTEAYDPNKPYNWITHDYHFDLVETDEAIFNPYKGIDKLNNFKGQKVRYARFYTINIPELNVRDFEIDPHTFYKTVNKEKNTIRVRVLTQNEEYDKIQGEFNRTLPERNEIAAREHQEELNKKAAEKKVTEEAKTAEYEVEKVKRLEKYVKLYGSESKSLLEVYKNIANVFAKDRSQLIFNEETDYIIYALENYRISLKTEKLKINADDLFKYLMTGLDANAPISVMANHFSNAINVENISFNSIFKSDIWEGKIQFAIDSSLRLEKTSSIQNFIKKASINDISDAYQTMCKIKMINRSGNGSEDQNVLKRYIFELIKKYKNSKEINLFNTLNETNISTSWLDNFFNGY